MIRIAGRWGAGLRIAPALILIAGCRGEASRTDPAAPASPTASKPDAGGPTLVFVTNGAADWWNAVESGMKEGAARYGAKAEMRRGDGQADRQIRILEEVAGRPDVGGVAVSVLDAEADGIADAMRKVKEAGKALITIDSDGAPDVRSYYIGTDNRAAGVLAGKAAAKVRPQGGTVVFFVGAPGASNAIARREGFLAGAGPAFRQVEVYQDEYDEGRAMQNARNAVSKYPDVGMLVGLWAYNAPAIADVFEVSPEKKAAVSVVTFDLDQRAIESIEKGQIDASVCQNPYEMGLRGVRALKALIASDAATLSEMFPGGAKTMDTGARVIVPKTVPASPVTDGDVVDIDAMKTWLKGKGLASS